MPDANTNPDAGQNTDANTEPNNATTNPADDGKGGDGGPETKTIPQAKVDEIVQARLARERAQWESKFEGIDPDKAREAISRMEKIEEEELLDKKQFQELLAKKQEKFESHRAELEAENDRLRNQLRSQTIDRTLADAAQRAVKPAHVAALLRDRVDLDKEGNVVVRNEEGKVLLDDDGAPVQVSQFVDAWLDENDHFLPAAGGRGTGGPGGGDPPGSIVGADPSDAHAIAADYQKRYDQARSKRG